MPFQHDETALSEDCRGFYCDDGYIHVSPSACVQNAECIQIPTDPYYQCACRHGYVGDGQQLCQLDACEYSIRS